MKEKEKRDLLQRLRERSQNKNTNKNPMDMSRIFMFFLLIMFGFFLFSGGGGPTETTWRQFKNNMLEDNEVDKVVVVNKEKAEVYIKNRALSTSEYSELESEGLFGSDSLPPGPHYYFNIGSVETFENKMDEATANFSEEEMVPISYEERFNIGEDLLTWLIPIGLLILFWVFISRGMSQRGGGGIFSMGKSKAKVYEKASRPKVRFDDVAGLEEAKEEIKEVVSYLKDKKVYSDLGAKIPKGILLVGPPGTGKTLMGKAIAGEADVPFLSISGSDFVEMFVGVGASRVRSLFDQAKKLSPCIIFIDEIDAIGRARRKAKSMQSNDEQENTLNQMLQELDGFDTNSGVIVLAATNRSDILDKALMRPGRFDRQIYFDVPNHKERIAILKIHTQNIKLKGDLDIDLLASQTPGFSGADLANLCNEAALIAARKQKKAVEQDDFVEAMDRTIAGLERRSKIIPEHEKRVIAYHEAGHAVVSRLLQKVENLVKVSIIPRGQSLGANWYREEEHQLHTKQQIYDKMCMALAGRAAEQIIFNEITSGALNDLEKITKMAYSSISMYGFNDKIGNISFHDSSGQWSESFQKPYSEHLGKMIDEEVQKLIDQQYKRSISLLEQHKKQLEDIAETLLEKEVLLGAELDQFFPNNNGQPKDKKEGQKENISSK
jgi:AFG3 family protein